MLDKATLAIIDAQYGTETVLDVIRVEAIWLTAPIKQKHLSVPGSFSKRVIKNVRGLLCCSTDRATQLLAIAIGGHQRMTSVSLQGLGGCVVKPLSEYVDCELATLNSTQCDTHK